MPASDFEAALSERVDYAVFVAYDTWARAVGYTSHNPYDVLARLLDGLPQALTSAAADRGGWSALDPVGGAPHSSGRQMVSEMASQVIAARVQAEAAHAPEIGMLTGLIVDAVSGAITVFMQEPGRIEAAGADAPHGVTLGERSAPTPMVEQTVRDIDAFAAPAQPDPVYDQTPTHEYVTVTGSSSARFDSWDSWLSSFTSIFGSSGEFQLVDPNGAVDFYIFQNVGDPPPTDIGAPEPAGPSTTDTAQSLFIAALVKHWEAALENAAFYRVDHGTVVRLSDAEAEHVVDALIARVVEQATQSFGTATAIGAPEPPAVFDPVVPIATVVMHHNDQVFPG